VLPLFLPSESTQISPPCNSIILFEINNPKPEPSATISNHCPSLSILPNCLNILVFSSSVNPIPLSFIGRIMKPLLVSDLISIKPPGGVYLTALFKRLV